MGTPTTHLGLDSLIKPATSDMFSTAVLDQNWQAIDDFPGTYLVTNQAALPVSWGANQTGMQCRTLDKFLTFTWDGSAFHRKAPAGLLATAQITTDFSTASGTPQVAVSAAATLPEGAPNAAHPIEVTASWCMAESTSGVVGMAIKAGSSILRQWTVTGLVGATNAYQVGSGGSMTITDTPGASPVTYALCIFAASGWAGTNYIRAGATGSSNGPASITVKEL